MENRCNNTDKGIQRTRRKTLSQYHFVHKKSLHGLTWARTSVSVVRSRRDNSLNCVATVVPALFTLSDSPYACTRKHTHTHTHVHTQRKQNSCRMVSNIDLIKIYKFNCKHFNVNNNSWKLSIRSNMNDNFTVLLCNLSNHTSARATQVLRPRNLLIDIYEHVLSEPWSTYKLSRSQWPCGLRRETWPVSCWDRGFESRLRHGCLSASFCVVLSCVGRGLATGWSLVRGVLSYV
jgi:hypothetical protein